MLDIIINRLEEFSIFFQKKSQKYQKQSINVTTMYSSQYALNKIGKQQQQQTF